MAELIQAYRPLRPALENWQKTRQLSRLPPYSTRYSPLQPADFERVAAAIDAALPENSGQLARANGVILDFRGLDRETVYVARDKSLRP